jgi:hypothetical protein
MGMPFESRKTLLYFSIFALTKGKIGASANFSSLFF